RSSIKTSMPAKKLISSHIGVESSKEGLPHHMRLELQPGNQATTVQRDLHVERVLFKLRGENHRLADDLRLAELLDFSHLLLQPTEERARFIQRQRRVHLLVEFGLDARVIARVDQLD